MFPLDDDVCAAVGGGTARSPQPANGNKLITTAARVSGMQAQSNGYGLPATGHGLGGAAAVPCADRTSWTSVKPIP